MHLPFRGTLSHSVDGLRKRSSQFWRVVGRRESWWLPVTNWHHKGRQERHLKVVFCNTLVLELSENVLFAKQDRVTLLAVDFPPGAVRICNSTPSTCSFNIHSKFILSSLKLAINTYLTDRVITKSNEVSLICPIRELSSSEEVGCDGYDFLHRRFQVRYCRFRLFFTLCKFEEGIYEWVAWLRFLSLTFSSNASLQYIFPWCLPLL